MKSRRILTCFVAAALFAFSFSVQAQTGRESISFNESWRFQKDDPEGSAGVLSYPNVALKNGKSWAEDIVKTTVSATQILIQPNRFAINADGQDLSFITVKVADGTGLTAPRSTNLISFDTAGPGAIVATGNSDPTDLTSFQSRSRKAFNGMALVVVRSLKGRAGEIRLRASSDSLKTAEIRLSTR